MAEKTVSIAFASPSALQDRGRPGALGLEDGGLLLALGGEDLGLLDALGGEDRGAAVALGAHLLLHRLLHRARRLDRLESTRLTRMPHLPVASSSTRRSCELIVSRDGQRLLERHAADHVAQRRDRELLDRLQRVGDLVGDRLRVGHLK